MTKKSVCLRQTLFSLRTSLSHGEGAVNGDSSLILRCGQERITAEERLP